MVTDEKNPLSAAGRKLLGLISGGDMTSSGGAEYKEAKKKDDNDGYF